MFRAKFLTDKSTRERLKKFNEDENCSTWYYVVCMNGKHHKDNFFAAFVELVNSYSGKLKEIYIITSCWLERHYEGESRAEELGDKWYSQHENILNKIKIKFKFFKWKDFFKDQEAYQSAVSTVEKMYLEDKVFKKIINDAAEKNARDGKLEPAKKYALEDAASAILFKGFFPYPGKSLNPALSYASNKFNPDLHILGYRLDPIQELQSNKEERKAKDSLDNELMDVDKQLIEVLLSQGEKNIKLINNCLKTVYYLKKLGIFTIKEQKATVAGIIETLNEHFSKDGTLKNEEQCRV